MIPGLLDFTGRTQFHSEGWLRKKRLQVEVKTRRRKLYGPHCMPPPPGTPAEYEEVLVWMDALDLNVVMDLVAQKIALGERILEMSRQLEACRSTIRFSHPICGALPRYHTGGFVGDQPKEPIGG